MLFALAAEYLPLLGTVVMEGNFRPGEHEPVLRALLARHAPVAAPRCCVVSRNRCGSNAWRRAQRMPRVIRDTGMRAWVAQAAVGGDAFLDIAGPRLLLAGDAIDPAHSCALIRSLANRQLV